MKIIELDGLITIEADEGKVLTTLAPSTLRTKLIYLGKRDNVDNYVEIDEEPEVELPEEEPNTEEPEVLNGLSLAEAYHYLLSENRVLKEENEVQDMLINTTMMAIDEMFQMLEPLLMGLNTHKIEGGVNPMVDMYVAMITRGLKTIDQVPVRYRDEVAKILAELEK